MWSALRRADGSRPRLTAIVPGGEGDGARTPIRFLDVGAGAPLVLMQGYALQPTTYLELGRLLAPRCRVLIPSLFEGSRRWSDEAVLDDLLVTLDLLGLERVSLLGHSFGGALALNFAARHPDRVTELVFVDTLAMSREWTLAAEAVHPVHLLWMATPRAAIDFGRSWASHPLQLVHAAWWGFTSDRREQVARVAATTIPCHVLWANRDSLLSRADGETFARDLGADFTVVECRAGRPVDHDWLYRHPHLAITELDRLGLLALHPPARAAMAGPGAS